MDSEAEACCCCGAAEAADAAIRATAARTATEVLIAFVVDDYPSCKLTFKGLVCAQIEFQTLGLLTYFNVQIDRVI